MRTIAVINQKGGVGKTTTVANLGAALSASGRNVCLVDLDPQAHLTLHFGIEPGSAPLGSYDVLTDETDIGQAATTVAPRLSVVPASIDLAAAEVELVTTVGREQILRDRLNAHPLPYDLVMIDCPPSLGLLTLNALAAADDVVIPLQPHFLALQGLGKLLETVALVRKRINPKLRVAGVVLCMWESNTRLSAEVLADLRGFFAQAHDTAVPWADAQIYRTVVRRNVKLAECPSYGRTIFDYEPSSHGAADYKALAQEIASSLETPRPSALAPAAGPVRDHAAEAPADNSTPPAGQLPAAGEESHDCSGPKAEQSEPTPSADPDDAQRT